ncbi:MAG: hypothetical protein KC415_22940 [Anaerolineales bacterium]|nr:hypothetical protein [Anaerolineales bacterium]
MALHIQIAEEMKAEGWQAMPQEKRLLEHERRYRAAMNGDGGLAVDDALALLTGASAKQAGLALAILKRIGQLRKEVSGQRHEVEQLEGLPRCNGWTHVNKAGALYIHHSSRSRLDCPLHGADIKDRGRVYVGQNHEKQQAAIGAIANHNAWTIAKKTLADLERALRDVDAALGRVGAQQQRLLRE